MQTLPQALPKDDPSIGRVLCLGGTDPTGAAGLLADMKTVSALGAYGLGVVTAVTVQTSEGVSDVLVQPASVVGAQMDAALVEIGADAIKTGMLGSVDVVLAVVDRIERLGSSARLVIDPVLAASSGRKLLSGEGLEALTERLIPKAALVTPNLHEAARLTGLVVTNRAEMSKAADYFLAMGAGAVLIKGGHLPDFDDSLDEVADLLRTMDGEEYWFVRERRRGFPFRGTGCALASAIAAGIATGLTLRGAVEQGRDFVERAMVRAPLFGRAARPLGLHVSV